MFRKKNKPSNVRSIAFSVIMLSVHCSSDKNQSEMTSIEQAKEMNKLKNKCASDVQNIRSIKLKYELLCVCPIIHTRRICFERMKNEVSKRYSVRHPFKHPNGLAEWPIGKSEHYEKEKKSNAKESEMRKRIFVLWQRALFIAILLKRNSVAGRSKKNYADKLNCLRSLCTLQFH